MLNAAEKFFAFYAALSAPVAPAGPAATERQTRFADDEDSTDAALFAAAAIAANRAAADVRGPATAVGGGAGPSGVVNGRPPSGGAPGTFGFPSYFAEHRMEQRRGSDDGAPVAGALVDAPVNLTDDSNLARAAG